MTKGILLQVKKAGRQVGTREIGEFVLVDTDYLGRGQKNPPVFYLCILFFRGRRKHLCRIAASISRYCPGPIYVFLRLSDRNANLILILSMTVGRIDLSLTFRAKPKTPFTPQKFVLSLRNVPTPSGTLSNLVYALVVHIL